MTRRDEFEAAFELVQRSVYNFSISDIDGDWRTSAMEALDDLSYAVRSGLRERDEERKRDEEAVVIKAWREGRVTIADAN